MINKHEVKIFLPDELKKDPLLNQIGFLTILENLKFVRFVNDIKMHIKDEVGSHHDNTTRELNVEHVIAYLNVEQNIDNTIKIWFTDSDHKLFGVSKGAKNREGYEILLLKKIAPQLIDLLNKVVVIYNTDVSKSDILKFFGWSYDEKSNCWTNSRMNHNEIQEAETWTTLKQEIVDNFVSEIKSLDF